MSGHAEWNRLYIERLRAHGVPETEIQRRLAPLEYVDHIGWGEKHPHVIADAHAADWHSSPA